MKQTRRIQEACVGKNITLCTTLTVPIPILSPLVCLDRLLVSIAYALRSLHFPHFLKYLLFLLIKMHYWHKDPVVTSPIGISQILVDLDIRDFIEYWIFMDGLFENDWIIKARDIVRGRVLIDVGANIGVYPLSLFGEAKWIYAFEPAIENYRRLVHNLEKNSIKNVTAIRKALFSRNVETANLYMHPNEKGWHSLFVEYSTEIEKVELITLDCFIDENGVGDIGLIKIDVVRWGTRSAEGLHKNTGEISSPSPC